MINNLQSENFQVNCCFSSLIQTSFFFLFQTRKMRYKWQATRENIRHRNCVKNRIALNTIQAEEKDEQLVLKVTVHPMRAYQPVHQSQLMPQQHKWISQLLYHASSRESAHKV
ncbi:hypothetical protein V6Z11_D07G022200 [Gossypium hirsutum]